MKKILIVDDSIFMRMHIKGIVEKNGYEVVGEAASGSEAIEKFIELRPDIVMMDITMPDMDGIAALNRLQSVDPNATVLMVSALGQEGQVKNAILGGARGFITKPFKPETILNALSTM